MTKEELKATLRSEIADLKSQYNDFNRITSKYKRSLIKKKLIYEFKFNLKLRSKQILSSILILACIILPTHYYLTNPNVVIVKGDHSKEYVYVDNLGKSDEEFLHDLGMFESSGKYNPSGNANYHGKYQFGRAALDAIGLSGITSTEFIQDTLLQEVAIRRLMKLNKSNLKDLIGKYEGKTIAGIYITQSGLLAGSHLGGSGNVRNFLESGGSVIFKDGNGTPITKYIKHFGGYNLHF